MDDLLNTFCPKISKLTICPKFNSPFDMVSTFSQNSMNLPTVLNESLPTSFCLLKDGGVPCSQGMNNLASLAAFSSPPPLLAWGQGAHHFVGQDAVDAVVEQVDEPVEALQLVLAHLAALDGAGLHADAVAHHRGVLVLQ